MSNILSNLHASFQAAIQQDRAYINIEETASKFRIENKKVISVSQVFEKAKDYATAAAGQSSNSIEELEKRINYISLLKKDCQDFHAKYEKKSNQGLRHLVKVILSYVPVFFKNLLPQLFSDRIQRAENLAQQSFNACLQSLNQAEDNLKSELLIQEEALFVPEEEEEDIPLEDLDLDQPPVIIPTDEVEEVPAPIDLKAIAINRCMENIKKASRNLGQATSPECFKQDLTIVLKEIQMMSTFEDVDLKARLQELNLPASLVNILCEGSLREAISDDQQLLKVLGDSEWGLSFKAALNQECKDFAMRPLGNDFVIVNRAGLLNFKGALHVEAKWLNHLKGFLKSNPSCSPCCIKVNFDSAPTLETMQILREMQKTIPFIVVENLISLDIADELTDVEAFLKDVAKLYFPDLQNINLSALKEHKLPTSLCQDLLDLCPNFDVLKKCYNRAETPSELIIPPGLKESPFVNFEGWPALQIQNLISQFSHIQILSLEKTMLSDDDLRQWIAQGLLDHVSSLNLKDCWSLTTDVLPALMELPNLRILSLPDLPEGYRPLDTLPKLNDAFKVAMFYTQSAATRPYARGLYEGPSIWASRFQIPLARQGETNIFSEMDAVLDPASVSYWLYKEDYKKLEPQDNVTTILADNSDLINDDNIVDFILRFPNLAHLSLHNCPNISNQGITKLLELDFLRLKSLDLSSCPNITNELLNEKTIRLMRPIAEIDISGTGIPETRVKSANLTKNVICRKLSLKITDDMLDQPGALEQILSRQDLFYLAKLDFEGCTKLTNADLSKVLDRLNTDIFLDAGQKKTNPQRLNIAELNLKGCTQVTEEAFKASETNGTIQLKLLENLQLIHIEGSGISKALPTKYPKISFENSVPRPLGHINLGEQRMECQAFYQSQQPLDESSPLARNLPKIIQNRIAIELFGDELDLQLRLVPIDFTAPALGNFGLAFLEHEDSAPSRFAICRDILYSQSATYRRALRPGGYLSKSRSISLVNQNATPAATKALIDLLSGKNIYQNLDWRTAANAAELANSFNLDLPRVYKERLLTRMQEQFTLAQADAMLFRASQLESSDKANAFAEYEEKLLNLLNSNNARNLFGLTGNGRYPLPRLRQACQRRIEGADAALARREQEALNSRRN